jgi:hypothetical protein
VTKRLSSYFPLSPFVRSFVRTNGAQKRGVAASRVVTVAGWSEGSPSASSNRRRYSSKSRDALSTFGDLNITSGRAPTSTTVRNGSSLGRRKIGATTGERKMA